MADSQSVLKQMMWAGSRFLWWTSLTRYSVLPAALVVVAITIISFIAGLPVWWLAVCLLALAALIAVYLFVRWRAETAKDATIAAASTFVVSRFRKELSTVPQLERIVATLASGVKPARVDLVAFGELGVAERLHERFPGLSTEIWDLLSDAATGQKIGKLRIAKLVGHEANKRFRKKSIPAA